VAPALNPFNRLRRRRSETSNSEKLYGAIVAQTRLPVFYRDLGVPDILEGRFGLLSLHLFILLHRLKGEGADGLALAQDLMDRFSQDMETVLRELGVSDVRVPKRMRNLAAAAQSQLEAYEEAFAAGEGAFAAAIAAALPPRSDTGEAGNKALTSYLMRCATELERQKLTSLQQGTLDFPEIVRS
jgi:cytochrome b pre-mRNA-processing protein 3